MEKTRFDTWSSLGLWSVSRRLMSQYIRDLPELASYPLTQCSCVSGVDPGCLFSAIHCPPDMGKTSIARAEQQALVSGLNSLVK